MTSTSPLRDWYFTFGSGHYLGELPLRGKYVKIYGTPAEARKLMTELCGTKWSMMYRSTEDAGVERHGLTEIRRSEIVFLKNAGARFTTDD